MVRPSETWVPSVRATLRTGWPLTKVPLVDPGVSRHHAELRVENGQVVLVDLSSTNGTFVNGQPVRRVALTDGTHVSLGRTTLVFRQDGQDDGQGTAYSRTTY